MKEVKIVEVDSSGKSTPNADATAGDMIILRRCLVSCITKYKVQTVPRNYNLKPESSCPKAYLLSSRTSYCPRALHPNKNEQCKEGRMRRPMKIHMISVLVERGRERESGGICVS